jgi:hypothetical protein
VRRLLPRGRPLHIPAVRAAPHRDLAIAVGLQRQPLHDIKAVPPFLDAGAKLAFGVAAPAHIDDEERVTVSRKEHALIVISLRNVWSQRHNGGRGPIMMLRQIQRGMQMSAIPQRNPYAPKPIVVADDRIGSLRITGTVVDDNVQEWVASLENAFPLRAVEEQERILLTPAAD